MTTLSHFLQSRWYWLSLALFGVALLGVALFYQYALDVAHGGECQLQKEEGLIESESEALSATFLS